MGADRLGRAGSGDPDPDGAGRAELHVLVKEGAIQMSPMGGALGMGTILLIPVLYAAVKIAAGILVLHYGKRYAEKVKQEEER